MSHPITIPMQFVGTPALASDKVATLKDWYVKAIADYDVAVEPTDASYYLGAARMAEGVLTLLYNNVPTDVVKVAKSSKNFGFKRMLIVGVVAYVLVDGRITKKVKAEFAKQFPTETKTKH